MFISMQKTNLIIHFFPEILHFKESCNLIGWQHREIEFCQIWDWWWNFNNNISFHFKLFPRKKKNLFWGHFGPAKMDFPGKKSTASFSTFQLSITIPKIRKSYWGKHQLTDRQTDASDFIRPTIGKFLGIICLVHPQNCSKPNLSPSP